MVKNNHFSLLCHKMDMDTRQAAELGTKLLFLSGLSLFISRQIIKLCLTINE
jgi:hypothetical protein